MNVNEIDRSQYVRREYRTSSWNHEYLTIVTYADYEYVTENKEGTLKANWSKGFFLTGKIQAIGQQVRF